MIAKKKNGGLEIEFANEGKMTRAFAKKVHISLKEIGKIIGKYLVMMIQTKRARKANKNSK